MKTLQHICFDKDGTLIDVHLYWSDIIRRRSKKILERFNLPDLHLSKLAQAMGVDLKQNRILPVGPVGYKARPAVIDAACSALKEIQVKVTPGEIASIFVEVDQDMQTKDEYSIQILKNVETVLKHFKGEGLKISIYSSDRSENLRRIMTKLNLIQYFDAMVGGDEVEKPKPDPEGFLKVCQKVNVPVNHSIYIGDTVEDMLMAKRCGALDALGVTTGLCSRSELNAECQNVFDVLDELVEFYNKGKGRV